MDVSAIAAGALRGAETRFNKAASAIAATNTPDAPSDVVSLSDQAVELLSAKNEYSVDARLAHVANELDKSTLDLLA